MTITTTTTANVEPLTLRELHAMLTEIMKSEDDQFLSNVISIRRDDGGQGHYIVTTTQMINQKTGEIKSDPA